MEILFIWKELININDLYESNDAANEVKWEQLFLTLNTNWDDRNGFAYETYNRHIGVISYKNFIYLICGWDGSRENDINYLDVKQWELGWAGLYLATVSHLTAMYVL